MKDFKSSEEQIDKLNERLKLLQNRFIGVALDYNYFIDPRLENKQIFQLRDNVIFRLRSSIFLFQTLYEHHKKVEHRFNLLYAENLTEFMQSGFEMQSLQSISTREIYTLFDSMMYHLCSIFDYVFRLINFAHGKTILDKPLWNKFRDKKNVRQQIYCSAELIPILQKHDDDFVYPLIRHRSSLIHTENDTGEFKLSGTIGSGKFDAIFEATSLFKQNFPEISKNMEDSNYTINYASNWLIDKTIEVVTDILFELKDDLERNKKVQPGSMGGIVYVSDDGSIRSPSLNYWGNRETF